MVLEDIQKIGKKFLSKFTYLVLPGHISKYSRYSLCKHPLNKIFFWEIYKENNHSDHKEIRVQGFEIIISNFIPKGAL